MPYDQFTTDLLGIPLYYIGNGNGSFALGSPMKPNEADKYFCGPNCASKFIKRECANESQRQNIITKTNQGADDC